MDPYLLFDIRDIHDKSKHRPFIHIKGSSCISVYVQALSGFPQYKSDDPMIYNCYDDLFKLGQEHDGVFVEDRDMIAFFDAARVDNTPLEWANQILVLQIKMAGIIVPQ